MGKRVWEYCGDVDVLGYGGTFLRRISLTKFHAIRFDNMDEACGRDNEGHPRYHGSLVEVDLATADLDSARDCFGFKPGDHEYECPIALAFAVVGYGQYAPLEDEASNNGHQIIRNLKRLSRELESDEDEYHRRMHGRPVNNLGQTAAEFQRGDDRPALIRGIMTGNKNATLIAKLMGVPQEEIDFLTLKGRELN